MEGNKRVRRRRRNTVERLKNLLILLLTLSAVVLTVRVLMFNGLVDKGPRGWLVLRRYTGQTTVQIFGSMPDLRFYRQNHTHAT